MAFRKIFFLLLACGSGLLLSQCAQIVTPNGGAKDVKAPSAVKYIPDSARTNFTGEKIEIIFNEYIQLNDLQKQLVISPPMNAQPEIKVKGKSLLIELKDTLKKNTTYTFNFGDAIRDITENNPTDNFQYIFSTGNYIDSLSLGGTVKNAFDMKTEKGILVMLYDMHDDSVPSKKLPSYFSKTNSAGAYKINNIRPGIYKAFALKDANNNYLYDVPAEQIAFSDTLINIKKKTSLNLFMFKDEPKKQKLLKQYVRGYGSIFLAYAKPVQSISYKPMNNGTKTETFLTEFNERRDTVQVWFPDFGNDSLKFQVTADENTTDTIKICTCLFDKAKQGRGEVFKLSAILNAKKDKLFDPNNEIVLTFNHPISKSNHTKIEIKEDSINMKNVNISGRNEFHEFSVIESSHNSKTKKIKGNCQPILDGAGQPLFSIEGNPICKGYIQWKENATYHLFIPPGTFTDIFGLTNDTIKLNFKTQEEKYYGTLKLTLKMKIRIAYILQLMNEKGEVFDFESSDKGIFSYKHLPPGSYKLRIIYDKNGDGKWTAGNYLEKKKPETVIYYSSPITIRSNWDLELDWTP